MNHKLFDEGGPHHIRDLGDDQYQMTVSLPTDDDGRLARECPNAQCSPGYFKVKPGTGITGDQVTAYCPYCRKSAEPNDFGTQEQARYVNDLVAREAHRGIEGLLKEALGLDASGSRKLGGGLISVEMTYQPGELPQVHHPFEDEVRRDVVCPHCTLEQTVFGLATWCADCGQDVFLTHIAAELGVTRRMIGDIPRRAELLGKRAAAKDLENCLEDVVSLFEAAMKAIVRRALTDRGESGDDIQSRFKRIGTAFQNVDRTRQELTALFGSEYLDGASWSKLSAPFEKRHPITHNLGVVDRKYLARGAAVEPQGREIRISTSEIQDLLAAVETALGDLYRQLGGGSSSGDRLES